jgi:cellulose synthase/poly-beta-1,6-N-acetylglucosamine synthase-like glycosyltransferase
VVDDGSTDQTAAVVKAFAGVRLIVQANAGPAAARNRGAREAQGSILVFTDDDCVPAPNWIAAMLAPFRDPEVIAAKGVYRTRQTALMARFVQAEYEDRYHKMAKLDEIDFIDTYSAAYRRPHFLEMGGYDTSFPVACAEDAELSYRMSARGWKMKFVPEAVVEHTHPDSFSSYLKKKYKFAFWRMLAVRKNPSKGIKDSHTPQIMKLQLLLIPLLVLSLIFDSLRRLPVPSSLLVIALFLVTTVPFSLRAMKKDPWIGLFSPVLLAARGAAQFAGVLSGFINTLRTPNPMAKNQRPERRAG